jgi:hypothetical protein
MVKVKVTIGLEETLLDNPAEFSPKWDSSQYHFKLQSRSMNLTQQYLKIHFIRSDIIQRVNTSLTVWSQNNTKRCKYTRQNSEPHNAEVGDRPVNSNHANLEGYTLVYW